ncbi:MarC family protein [Luteimonas cucumeris]|nr:MarC family protein [Luteimonas cucumeris]
MLSVPALPSSTALTLAEVFLLLFVTLGPPLKVPALFLQATSQIPEPEARKLSLQVFLIALVTTLAGGFIGRLLMDNWHISRPALLMAGGLVFLFVSMQSVLGQYHAHPPAPAETDGKPKAFSLAVPMVVTPYGLAAVIVLLANSWSHLRTMEVCALLLAVMLLNLVAMYFARPIMRTIGPIPLQILGVIIGIMTVALSIQIILGALTQMGVL